MKRAWVYLILAPIIGIMMAATQVYYYVNIWSYQGPETTFEIRPGEGFAKINYRLKSAHLISNAKIFHRYAQFNGIMSSFKAGAYEIQSGATMTELANLFTKGQTLALSVTVPEGKNLYEIGKILEEKGITSYQDFVSKAKDANLMNKLNIPADSAEGYLYPETYNFGPNTSAEIVIRTMLGEFRKKIRSLDFEQTPLSQHETIILASIVEKETGAKQERKTIAGVYLNRLKKHMRLYSDPTTIYGIFEKFDGNLTRGHLREKTPYNTYRISGLPKGPIANPGLEAIDAVIHPQQHSFLYFVSKNDGTHVFTKNYKEHLKAVETFQKTRSNRVGKSWRDLKQD